MIFLAMPKLPKEIAEPTELVQELWWTARCKSNYSKLSSNYKKLFSELVKSIAILDFKKANGHHDVILKGIGEALEAHLEPNLSAEADDIQYGLKRKGKDIFLYQIKQSGDVIELQIINVGDHSVLKENYKNINR